MDKYTNARVIVQTVEDFRELTLKGPASPQYATSAIARHRGNLLIQTQNREENEMQTEELVAGRELDALVAEKMGWRRVRAEPWQCLNYSPEHNHDRDHCAWIKPGDSDDTRWDGNKPPHYSTEISAAWEVLDEMVWRVGTANIRLDMEDYGRGAMNDGGAERAAWVTIGDYTAFGPAPLAICKAALAAVNG